MMAKRVNEQWIGDMSLSLSLERRGGPHEAPFQWNWQILERTENVIRIRVYGAIPVYGDYSTETMHPDLAEAMAVILKGEEIK